VKIEDSLKKKGELIHGSYAKPSKSAVVWGPSGDETGGGEPKKLRNPPTLLWTFGVKFELTALKDSRGKLLGETGKKQTHPRPFSFDGIQTKYVQKGFGKVGRTGGGSY